MLRNWRVTLLAGIVTIACGHHALAEIRYNLTDLWMTGASYCSGQNVNDSGQVASYYYASADDRFCGGTFVYSNGVLTNIGTSWMGGAAPTAINNRGQIVGGCSSGATLYSDGVATCLGTFGGAGSWAYDINDQGQVVGNANDFPGFDRAFLYMNGTMTDLGTLGGNNATAFAINSKGQVVGEAEVFNDSCRRAFLWTPTSPNGTTGTMINLGVVPNGFSSAASDINDMGQVVGRSLADGGYYNHAFLYSDGKMVDLIGSPSCARAINNKGQIVGDYEIDRARTTRAFFYEEGHLVNLNTLIDPSLGWTLTYAKDINDSGWIVGQGLAPNGQTHGFLLTPVPEPSTLALLGISMLGMLVYGYRKYFG